MTSDRCACSIVRLSVSAIRVVAQVQPGFWELNGYPTNGWLDGTTGPTNPNPNLT